MDFDLDRSAKAGNAAEAEPERRQQIQVTMDAAVLDRLNRWAKRRGQTRSGCAVFLLTEGLDRWDQAEKERQG